MIATSKISTQGLQINSSDTNLQRVKISQKNKKRNISKQKNINKLDNLFKISLNFENNFLKNLDDSYKSSIGILDETYEKSIIDLDDSYKASIANLENTYNISKNNLKKAHNKSKKILESNFDKAFTYLKKNFEIKQRLDKEKEEELKKDQVIQKIYEPLKWNNVIKNKQVLQAQDNDSNNYIENTKKDDNSIEKTKEVEIENVTKEKLSWDEFIQKRKEKISEEQKKIQEEKNKLMLEKRIQLEKEQERRIQLEKQEKERQIQELEKRQIEERRIQIKKQTNNMYKNDIKYVENLDPPDISDFFLNKKIDSEEYKYALNIYSGIGPTKTQLYKNNRPSISYSEDLEISQGYINWKNVEYITNSKFIMFVLYSNECKNEELQTELINKNFSGNVQVSDLKVLNTKFEYCKNPTVIINDQEIKFQYQIILKFKVDNKVELNSNINISWLLEF